MMKLSCICIIIWIHKIAHQVTWFSCLRNMYRFRYRHYVSQSVSVRPSLYCVSSFRSCTSSRSSLTRTSASWRWIRRSSAELGSSKIPDQAISRRRTPPVTDHRVPWRHTRVTAAASLRVEQVGLLFAAFIGAEIMLCPLTIIRNAGKWIYVKNCKVITKLLIIYVDLSIE